MDINPYNFAKSQVDFNQALKELRQELEVPNQNCMHKQLAKVKDPEERAAWQKFLKKKEQTAYEEACMHNIAGVAGIVWIPANLDDASATNAKTKKIAG